MYLPQTKCGSRHEHQAVSYKAVIRHILKNVTQAYSSQ